MRQVLYLEPTGFWGQRKAANILSRIFYLRGDTSEGQL